MSEVFGSGGGGLEGIILVVLGSRRVGTQSERGGGLVFGWVFIYLLSTKKRKEINMRGFIVVL